nr:hypothetical protein [Tanacetum cinerariifolium]
MSYLTDYEKLDGGYVAFGGNPKGGKITGKYTIKTGNLDFKNVYFVGELKFNLFSVSQIVPRKNNMYSVDLKNIVPKGGLTCLFAKATSDESKLWHRRLGHFKYKTMNKLVKGNLDETSGILKSFITRIENLVDHKMELLKQYSVTRAPQQNRVAKRRNMTLIKAARTMIADSKTLTLSFMRPFGCPVTILNTKDHLGKFYGKADEGFFVEYSLNSKAFRVFNSRTRIVEENFHIRFSENTPNVVGSKPNWLFDVNALTRTMNYEPIVTDDGFKPLSDDGNKVDENLCKENECNDQEKEDNVNSTNNVNTISLTVNAAGTIEDNKLLFDPNMPTLEDFSIFNFSNDDDDDDIVANMDNMYITIQVSPILTTRFHKDQPLDQVIRDLHSTTQTGRVLKNLEEHGFVSTIHQRKNHKSLQNCLFAFFLSQEEPKKVIHALKDPSWIKAMQEELLQFKLQEVWTLVDLPNVKRAIVTKWVFGNKEDERGIMIRYKERLITQGHTQEEGFDYDEVFTPVAKIKAIRLFLAYASFKDFVVYHMEVKSAFLYGKIKEEVYVCQPLGFKDPDFPDRVYKVEKAVYGLHQAPRAWHKGDILLVQVYVDDIIFGSTRKELCNAFERLMHEKFPMSFMGELTFFLGLQVKQKNDGVCISQGKYVAESLKKFGFTKFKNASTLMKTQNPLLKDEDGEEVDVHMYRCQVNPKLSHLYAVKRIFRYSKGQPKLGLLYPKDSPFDLVAYTDSDYA